MEDTETVELNIGALVRFFSTTALFWGEQDSFGPDFGKQYYANEIYHEKENPLAMILGADFTGVYVRVLWGEKKGWVMSSDLQGLA
jgi:hypothetical protein